MPVRARSGGRRPAWSRVISAYASSLPIPSLPPSSSICSSDVGEELAALSDRVAVLYHGAAAGVLAGPEADQHRILETMNSGAT